MNKPFSFGVGSPATGTSTTTAGTGLFGSPQPAQATQPSTGLFSFNKPATTGTTPSLSSSASFSGFGALNKTVTAAPAATGTFQTSTGFGGFAKPAGTTGGTSLFGQPTTGATTAATGTTGFSGFGGFSSGTTQLNTSTTAQPTTFGGFGSTGTGTSLFGGQQQSQPTATGGSLFSLSTQPANTTLSFNQPQQQQQQQQLQQSALLNQTQIVVAEQDQLLNSMVNPQVFNDERDAIISKWNQLQALYGAGKIFYQNSVIDVNKENQFNRFKTIGYSCRIANKNEDGLVGLIIGKKESEVRDNQKTIIASLHKIFNSDPALSIVIESIKPCADDKTEVVFYVNQRVSQLTDQTNRVASMLVCNHLNKQEVASNVLMGLKTTPTIKQQLEQINVLNVFPLVGLTEEQLKSYLDTLPSGLNPLLWDQAKKNNPNPKKLIPVQVVGFKDINDRFKKQEDENKTNKESISIISQSIENLNSRNKILRSKIDQFKARNEDLEQRILKVMISYEIRRKIGLPLQENEKYLLSILDSFQMELNSPINREIQRQKLTEFVEMIKTLENNDRQWQQYQQQQQQQQQQKTPFSTAGANSGTLSADPNSLADIQKSLREQHKAFKSLIDILNKDLKDLSKIKKGIFNEK